MICQQIKNLRAQRLFNYIELCERLRSEYSIRMTNTMLSTHLNACVIGWERLIYVAKICESYGLPDYKIKPLEELRQETKYRMFCAGINVSEIVRKGQEMGILNDKFSNPYHRIHRGGHESLQDFIDVLEALGL